MRNMSFSATIEQYKDRSKTVTRRLGWWNLKKSEQIRGVEKAMGLKKGEKIKSIGVSEVISTRPEPLCAITDADCILEGFPHFKAEDFINMMMEKYRIPRDKILNRIEFKHVVEPET